MTSLSRRATTCVVVLCVFFVATLLAVGIAGVLGVRADHRVADDIADDELSTTATTAQVSQAIDRAYIDGRALQSAGGSDRERQAVALYDRQIPAVESAIADLVDIHADDEPAEQAKIDAFVGEWHRMRSVLNAMPEHKGASTAAASSDDAPLTAAYQPLAGHISQLADREQRDATEKASVSSSAAATTIRIIVAVMLGSLLVVAGAVAFVVRRLRRAVDPAAEQAAFADTLQLARDETEAHLLLQRYVERSAERTTATVFNRNNSADRLEAMTPLPDESPLREPLAQAEPGSCLAVRSGRVQRAGAHEDPLLACALCSTCPGSTLCAPLTVGGEVIGSVLANRPDGISGEGEKRIRDSVAQAAPVLANLRNLAIAETRASTDSLTGLPNKRAIENQLKQMVAHATRSELPMSVLLLDLDHFKEINDRLGHPVGDTALANVGAALRASLREGDVAGRSGGEEFLVLLPGTDGPGAVEVADRIREAISSLDVPGNDRPLSASIGVATCPDHASTAERLVRLADAALYLAKRSGRNRTELATTGPAARGGGIGHLMPVAQDVAPN